MARNYPAICALGAVVVGIILADISRAACWFWLVVLAALVPAIMAVYYAKHARWTGLFALTGLMAISAFGYSYRCLTMPPGHVSRYAGDKIVHTIYGTVVDWPTVKEHRTDIVLRLDSIGTDGVIEGGRGRLLLHIQTATTRLQYGDRLYADARIYPIRGGNNPTGFDYRRYLNLRGIFAVAYVPHPFALQVDSEGRGLFYKLIDQLRSSMLTVFQAALDADAAALASGFLIGETRNISPRVYELFRDTGTLHLLAVSGSNVALVVLVFVFLMRASPLSLRIRTLVLLLVVLVFSYLAYNQPSVVRAAVMATLVLLGKVFQRRIDLNNIIASSALIILLVQPTELFDVGFQLSFVTAWALIVLVPIVSRRFAAYHHRWYYRYGILPLVVCVVAQVASLPMSAFYFQRLPLIAFISNLVIVPLVSVAVLGEMVLLLAWLILPLFGQFIGSLLNPLLQVIITLLEIFGSDTAMVSLSYRLSGPALVCYYLLLGLGTWSISSRSIRRLFVFAVLLLANIGMLLPLVKSDQAHSITVFSVSGGYVAINRFAQTQVVLCRLPLSEYSYSDKVIAPYVHNMGLHIDQVIALGGEYQTICEAVALLASEPEAIGYFPDFSRPLVHDVCLLTEVTYDSLAVVFCGVTGGEPMMPTGGSCVVSHAGLRCQFDSGAVVYASDETELSDFCLDGAISGLGLTVIKPCLRDHDILALDLLSMHDLQYVVCNKVTRGVERGGTSHDLSEKYARCLFVTSQVGAVELVIKDGRAMMR